MTAIPLTELWVLGGLTLSLVSQLSLVRYAAHGRRSVRAVSLAVAPLVMVVVLMVLKPTWAGLS